MQQAMAQAFDPLTLGGGGAGMYSRLMEGSAGPYGAGWGRMPGGGGGGMAASWGDGDAANTGAYSSLAQVGAAVLFSFFFLCVSVSSR